MGALIEVVLPVFFVLGFGYLAAKRGWISSASVDGLMVFSQKFAIPCLLFLAISQLDLGQSFDLRLLASFYVGAISGFAAGILGARFLFGRPWEDCIAIGFCCLFSNSLLLGLPISERAYGEASLAANFTIISIHSPFCYLIGITAMEMVRNAGRTRAETARAVLKAMFSNALIIGIVLGLAFNLTGLAMPGVLEDALDLMRRAALPTALFGLGGVLVRYRPEGDLATAGFVVAVSLILHPAVTLGLGQVLGVPHDTLRNGVVTAAMAPGVNSYLFADMYGKARRVAATGLLLGTALCVVTAWIWLQLLG
ncbi:AEC family transporter [Mangrovicoccus algicola]|uniref:AEC family transporter n=1 Tax=Mangrovicoccus algicola TaxID=2771008 RepID=A0A8J7D0S9_9RHOB|nr:AEC family transporter [Mangrovicoccus algicola]MBE3639913.1 AEC family transporter [Mangrovicoccus algicola]